MSIKRETPWLISDDEAYILVALGGILPKEDHNELLRSVLKQIRERRAKKQDKIRVVFEGGFCEQPPLDLLRTISQSCYVVDDDLLIGLRWIVEDVPLDGDNRFQTGGSLRTGLQAGDSRRRVERKRAKAVSQPSVSSL